MYERFTDRARKVMHLANQEAQRFNHEYIGTEHLLLAIKTGFRNCEDFHVQQLHGRRSTLPVTLGLAPGTSHQGLIATEVALPPTWIFRKNNQKGSLRRKVSKISKTGGVLICWYDSAFLNVSY